MNIIKLRTIRFATMIFLAAALAGCVSVKLPPPVASAETLEKLRGANIAPAKTGTFKLAEGKNPGMDKSLSGLRGSSLEPDSGSFSQHLKDVIIAELKAAALYDENSPIQIDAELTDSMVDAAIGTGRSRLSAHFVVIRAGKRVFDKELVVASEWESSFVGAIALPAAINQYSSLYKSLAAKLFDDPDFRTALAR